MFDWLGTLLTESPRTDLLRLAAVPVFGWAAYRDVLTRRVPNRTWLPLAALGVVLLAWDAWRVASGAVPGGVTTREWFFLRVAISLGMVAPIGYLFYWFGGFGGADAKALIVLAVLFPTYPELLLPASSLPVVRPTIGVFSLTILTNTVVVGAVYPLGVACKNAATGHVGTVMLIGKPVRADAVTTEYGSLLQTPDGFTRRGVDLDALRMYLRWRGTTLAAVRADPATHRDPASLPAEPNPPGDGSIRSGDDADPPDDAVATDGGPDASNGETGPADGDPGTGDDESDGEADADPWGAAAFLDDVEGDAYGTTPEKLRDGLEVLVAEDTVWISPGLPFIVPMFLGLVVSVVYGDVLVAVISALA